MEFKYSKNQIIEIIKEMFPKQKIMFAYFCGSIAYHTFDETSDIDVSVIIDDFSGSIHMEADGIDFFAYGIDCYLGKQQLKPEIPNYYKMHIDDVIEIDKNLIYLNREYCEAFNAYKTIDWKNGLGGFLDSFTSFHDSRMEKTGTLSKRLYHVFRIRGMLDHYDESGCFEHIVKEPWKSFMLDYKKNWNNPSAGKYRTLICEQLEYIKQYSERTRDYELG